MTGMRKVAQIFSVLNKRVTVARKGKLLKQKMNKAMKYRILCRLFEAYDAA